MRDIQEALKEHKQAVLDYGIKEEQLLVVALYGSQNYGLATENSDVDTKAIYIPTLEELCSTPSPRVKELSLPNNEKCVLMDIRHFADNLKKQNLNYVEILFTDYYLVNKDLEFAWAYLRDIREQVAFYDPNKAVLSMAHQAKHTLYQDPFDKSKYARSLFLSKFLHTYMEAVEFNDELTYMAALHQPPHVIEEILNLKTGKVEYTYEDTYNLRKHFINLTEMRPYPVNVEHQEKVDKALLRIIVGAVRTFEFY